MQLKILGAAALCAMGLAACGSSPTTTSDSPYYGSSVASNSYTEFGRVTNIETIVSNDGKASGAGAVIGGVVGGVLGHQVGSGRGNTAATVGGAVAGAVVGNEVEKRRNTGEEVGYRVDVRMDNGGTRSEMMDYVGDLRVGDRVRIADGRIARY